MAERYTVSIICKGMHAHTLAMLCVPFMDVMYMFWLDAWNMNKEFICYFIIMQETI